MSESNSTARQRFAAIIVAFVLAVGAAAATAFAAMPIAPVPAFVPVFGSLIAACDLLTAYLLAIQARVNQSLPLGILALAYLFSALIVVPHVLTFPGIFAGSGWLGARSQTAVWLWVWWHGGFPVIVMAGVCVNVYLAGRPIRVRARYLAAGGVALAALVAGLTWFTIVAQNALPVLIKTGQYGTLVRSGVGPAVLVTIGIALVSLIVATRLQTVTQLWLSVALWTSFLDCALTLVAGGRYTLGWYMARVASLGTATIVLIAMLGTIAVLFDEFARRSRVDGLTGLANRHSFDESLAVAIALVTRTGGSTSLVMIDVDFFKAYNDRYGHVMGDAALRAIAHAIRSALRRRSDIVSRYGGEEFAAILSATAASDANRLADMLRVAVERLKIPHTDAPGGYMTVSVGVGTLTTGRSRRVLDGKAFISIVDRALYTAKHRGRNCVVSVPGPDVALAMEASAA